jgi:hypothetical protein
VVRGSDAGMSGIFVKQARDLVAGDVFLNNGATVEESVVCCHGSAVYLRYSFADGESRVETVDATLDVPTWREDMSETRTAIVRGARSEREVAAYLPAGYRVISSEPETELLAKDRVRVTIAGTDSAGWTLEDYVIPRLASGLMSCEEVTS